MAKADELLVSGQRRERIVSPPNRYMGPRMTQIHWNAERKVIKWGTETADRFVPAVLRFTDNAETALEELRITFRAL